MPKCKDCSHMILCETFGEYKCTARKIRIQNPESQKDCEFYKKTKAIEKTCHCENCEGRTEDE